MVIIGGLGSLIGSFFGAAFLSILPTALKFGLPALGVPIAGAAAEHVTFMLVGALIIIFLIVEPHGLAPVSYTHLDVYKRQIPSR